MLLLIDAYNLLHLSDQLGRQRADGWLRKARERLVSKVAGHLGPELSRQTCLVFDSKDGPTHLPSSTISHGIELLFAVNHDEADDLLEELISRHATPKRLMVVSSDHRIQRAASRRGAKFMDADVWYDHLVERGPRLAIDWVVPATADPSPTGESPVTDMASRFQKPEVGDVEGWLKEFAIDAKNAGITSLEQLRPGTPEPDAGKPDAGKPKDVAPYDKPEAGKRLDPDLANPFPDGYGEDLLE